MLPVTLPALLDQDYPGDFEVILVDDGSSDGTAEVAERLATRHPARPADHRGQPASAGMGRQGMGDGTGCGAGRRARTTCCSPMPISPARPGTLTALVAAAEGDDRDLVSQMALLRAESFWERAVVPAFVYFFAQLYPFRRVNRPGARTAAAAGGCMLVRRRALDASGGLAGIRGARIDDVALGRQLKRRHGGRCWLGLTTGVSSVRPYPGLAGLWHMIARSAYLQLRHSPVLLAGTIAGLAWLYALPPAAALAGIAALALGGGAAAAWCAGAGLAGWALMAVSFVPMLRLYRLSVLRAPCLPLIAVLYAAMTLDSARRHYAGQGGRVEGPGQPGWLAATAASTIRPTAMSSSSPPLGPTS